MNSALVPVFPADLIDADHVEHTTTYSTNADGTYIYGEDFDDRKQTANSGGEEWSTCQ